MRRILTVGFAVIVLAWMAVSPVWPADGQARPVVIGAVYPTGGPQGVVGAGIDEYHGLLLAARYVNEHGGVLGRPVEVRLAPANSVDAAAGAVQQLAEGGITVIVGTYGSVIARPAAVTAARLGLLYWETGAVGEIGAAAGPGTHFFRVAPNGETLGRQAVDFVETELAPRLGRVGRLRYTVAYVDDGFGRAEARGEIAEVRRLHLPLAATLPYDPWHADYAALAARIARARSDVLIVAAYMENAVALREAVLRARVPLTVNIGGCSAYIMPQFGQRLGPAATGVFSSDKTGDLLPARALTRQAAQQLEWARRAYAAQYGHPLWEPGLSGFAGGIALFQDVLPRAGASSPAAVAAAARQVRLPAGTLPNGSGLAFGPPGSAQAGENVRAASVVWEWIAPYTRALVWPPAFATHAIVLP